MYGDLQYTTPSTGNKFKGNSKVYKFKAHEDTYPVDFIAGFTGTAEDLVTVISYFTRPDLFKKPPSAKCAGLVLTAENQIFIFDTYTKWLAVNEPYAAVGSGSGYALGAMASGLSPKEAVKVAMKHDAFTGFGIKGYTL